MGAVINCSSYEKEASRSLSVAVQFQPASVQNVNKKDVTLVTQLSLDR